MYSEYHNLLESLYFSKTNKDNVRVRPGCVFKIDGGEGLPIFNFYEYEKHDMIRPLVECLWLLRGKASVEDLNGLFTGMLQACVFEQTDPDDSTKTIKTTGLGDSVQMRRFGFHPVHCEMGFDQLRMISDFLLQKQPNPYMIISFWNPNAFLDIQLFPNVIYIQFFIEDNMLHLSVYCRELTALYEFPTFVLKWLYFLHLFATCYDYHIGHLHILCAQFSMMEAEYERWGEFRDTSQVSVTHECFPTLQFKFDETKDNEHEKGSREFYLKRSQLFVQQLSSIHLGNYVGVEEKLVDTLS